MMNHIHMNYGYHFDQDKLTLYFHCAKQGRKVELLKINPKVAFSIDGFHDLVTHQIACKNTILYRSIMGEGIVEFIDEETAKLQALRLIMLHLTGTEGTYLEQSVKEVLVVKINILSYCGKMNCQ
jgi:uncharacterized protein